MPWQVEWLQQELDRCEAVGGFDPPKSIVFAGRYGQLCFFFAHKIFGISGRDIEIYLLDPLSRSDQAQCRVAVETQKDLERRLERAELREVGQRKGILGTTLGSWKPTVCRWFLLAFQKGGCDEF